MSGPGEILFPDREFPVDYHKDRVRGIVTHFPWSTRHVATCTRNNGPWEWELDRFVYREWTVLHNTNPFHQSYPWVVYDPQGNFCRLTGMRSLDMIRTITWIAENGWPESWKNHVHVR